jgi:hypothetical protein
MVGETRFQPEIRSNLSNNAIHARKCSTSRRGRWVAESPRLADPRLTELVKDPGLEARGQLVYDAHFAGIVYKKYRTVGTDSYCSFRSVISQKGRLSTAQDENSCGGGCDAGCATGAEPTPQRTVELRCISFVKRTFLGSKPSAHNRKEVMGKGGKTVQQLQ